MFLNIHARIAVMMAMVVATTGLLTGCVNIDPGPGAPSVGVTMPTIAPVPTDPTKPLGVHAEEWKGVFAKIYCPVRTSDLGRAIAEEGKRLWNEFAAEAQRQGAPIPGFDPSDPKMCQ